MLTKSIFLIISLLFFDGVTPENIMVFLTIAIFFTLSSILPKSFRPLCHLAFILLLAANPTVFVFFPVFVYDLYQNYKFLSLIALLFCLYPEKNPFIPAFSVLAFYFAFTESSNQELIFTKTVMLDDMQETLIQNQEMLSSCNRETRNEIEIAILNERNRIAREIHDSIGHSLSSCILQVEVLKLQNTDSDQQKKLAVLQQTLQSGMQEIRLSLHNLHDSSLDLKREMEDILFALPLKSDLHFASHDDMKYSLKLGILSAFKEVLTNIAKHSDAKYVRIQFFEHRDCYSLSVKDNGHSTSAHTANLSLGIGLQSIADFSRKHGGNLHYGFENDGFFVHMTLRKELS